MDVDLVINSFERTYRNILAPGFFSRIAAQNRFRFARRIALINNVEDLPDAERRAVALVRSREIDDYHRVDLRADHALATTGLTRRDLGAGLLHSLPSLVAVTLPGSPWLVHWDAEVTLTSPGDWITPAIDLMERDERVLVANPRWASPKLDPETIERAGRWDLGHGFSDQLYLVRRSELAGPIYDRRCVVRRRYPLAHRGYLFEARVDAYLRHSGRLRAIDRQTAYVHDDSRAGESYPELNLGDRARLLANRAVIAAVRASPMRPHCCRAMARETR